MSGKIIKTVLGNEDGMLLITSLLVLVLLTIIGVSMTSDSVIELNIAGNDRLHKETFYEADGGTEWSHEVLEQNIACLTGFNSASGGLRLPDPTTGNIYVQQSSVNMWLNSMPIDGSPLAPTSDNIDPMSPDYVTYATDPDSDDPHWDMFLPDDTTDITDLGSSILSGQPMTIVKLAGNASLATGAAIQMAAGYEGKGKSIGMGGAILEFTIGSRRLGRHNSEANVCLGWRHTIGQEGDCYY